MIYKRKVKKFTKDIRRLVSEKKIKEAELLLPQIYKILDKAAKVGVIKKNTASRKKSRITRAITRAG